MVVKLSIANETGSMPTRIGGLQQMEVLALDRKHGMGIGVFNPQPATSISFVSIGCLI